MTEPQRPPKGPKGALADADAVRFEVVRLPSGMYTHRTAKVVIPAPKKRT